MHKIAARNGRSHWANLLRLSAVVIIVIANIFLLDAVVAATQPPPSSASLSWIRTQRLTNERGQPGYNFSTSVSSLGNLLAVGSTSANRGKGEVVIFFDSGNGLRQVAVLRDPSGGIIGDSFGVTTKLFVSNGFKQVAVGATTKAKDGRVFIFQASPADATQWTFIQLLAPPVGVYVSYFGRRLVFDGLKLLVSAERRYQSGSRFVLSFVNVIGTHDFIQSNGVDSTISGDPLLVFQSVPDRDNKAYFAFDTTIADADFSLDVGKSCSVSGNFMAVGASFREELKYGSGSDGDLIVDGVHLLDGAASYNFNSVTVKKGGVLTVDHYDSIRQIGGIMNVKVKTLFLIEDGGAVNVSGGGYLGGPTSFTSGQGAEPGQFTGGGGAARTNGLNCAFTDSLTVGVSINSVGGVVAGSVQTSAPFATANGGGGGYGTAGVAGTNVYCGTSGAGGGTYGDQTLSVAYRGSGGGSGQAWSVGSGGAGGNGGGVLLISAKKFINYGHVVADGGHGSDGGFYSGAGGGGSGGSIRLRGDTLINHGYIYARGGAGGARATGSGSGGTSGVVGGSGGMGRIYFDFLLTQSHGIVVPRPDNVTTYLGDVLLYKRNVSTKEWSLFTILPRHPSMMFVGHQVAVSGNTLAVASDQLTPVNPTQKVFLIDLTTVTASMVQPNYTFTVISPPTLNSDLGFGYGLAMSNHTLVVSAAGSANVRGAVYIYKSLNLLADPGNATTLVSSRSVAGDNFGNAIELDFPKLYVQLPLTQDVNVTTNPQRSAGNVQLFKFVRNVSAAHSYVTCEFATVTANVTLNCTVHLFATDNVACGDLHDIPFFSSPAAGAGSTAVDFRAVGVYTFQITLLSKGVHNVSVLYQNQTVAGPLVTVTNPINVLHTNVTCSPMQVVAGKSVLCTIHTANHSGEAIAAREFDVSVFVMDDLIVPVDGFNTITPVGVYRSPQSPTVSVGPSSTDYPLLYPTVTFVRHGVYTFQITTTKPGTYAAYIMYKREALEYPNPVVFDATMPQIFPSASSVQCPTFSAPNRTMACILYAKSTDGSPAGDPSFAKNLSSVHTVTAFLVPTSGAKMRLQVVGVFSGEGRFSILMVPPTYGSLSVAVQIHGSFLPAAATTVAHTYNASCTQASRVLNSFTITNQAVQGSTDASVYGISATAAGYNTVTGVCDQPNI